MNDVSERKLRVGRVLLEELGPFRAVALAADLSVALGLGAGEPGPVALAMLRKRHVPDPERVAGRVAEAWHGAYVRPRRETVMLTR